MSSEGHLHLPNDPKQCYLVVSTDFIIKKLKNLRVCHNFDPRQKRKKLTLAMPLFTLTNFRSGAEYGTWMFWVGYILFETTVIITDQYTKIIPASVNNQHGNLNLHN